VISRGASPRDELGKELQSNAGDVISDNKAFRNASLTEQFAISKTEKPRAYFYHFYKTKAQNSIYKV